MGNLLECLQSLHRGAKYDTHNLIKILQLTSLNNAQHQIIHHKSRSQMSHTLISIIHDGHRMVKVLLKPYHRCRQLCRGKIAEIWAFETISVLEFIRIQATNLYHMGHFSKWNVTFALSPMIYTTGSLEQLSVGTHFASSAYRPPWKWLSSKGTALLVSRASAIEPMFFNSQWIWSSRKSSLLNKAIRFKWEWARPNLD